MDLFTHKNILKKIRIHGYDIVYDKYEEVFKNVKNSLLDLGDFINNHKKNKKINKLKNELNKLKNRSKINDIRIEEIFDKLY